MDPILLLTLAVVGLTAFVVLLRSGAKPRSRRKLPFTQRDSLLTAAELRFYRILVRAVPSGLAVFVKVRLLDVVSVGAAAWRQYGAPASGMHLDFVLADAGTLAPVLVIELDDCSHSLPERQKRDAFKDAALDSGGVSILRVPAARHYEEGNLRAKIKAALGS